MHSLKWHSYFDWCDSYKFACQCIDWCAEFCTKEHYINYFIFLLSNIKKQALEGFAFSIGISSYLCQIFCVNMHVRYYKYRKEERTQPTGWVEKLKKIYIVSQDKLLPQKHVTWVCEVLPFPFNHESLSEGGGHLIILFMMLFLALTI